MGFETLKLEFADDDDTVIYLGNACPLCVSRTDMEDHNKYEIRIIGNDFAWALYYSYDKDKRDVDYNYAIEQIDIMMGVDREGI